MPHHHPWYHGLKKSEQMIQHRQPYPGNRIQLLVLVAVKTVQLHLMKWLLYLRSL